MTQFQTIKESPIPLYSQVRESLRQRINDGTYTPDSQLPAESEMSHLFGVSRITVRQALSELEREGIIFKVPGKGTFVSRAKASQDLAQLEGFAEALSRKGHRVFNQVISHAVLAASPVIANHLQVPLGMTVSEIKRVRYVDREAVSYEVTYLPEHIGENLRKENLAARDIFSILETDLRIPLGHADIQIGAINADAEQAIALHVEEGAALLRIERLTFESNGKPLDFEYLYFRADAFQYRLQIPRHPHTPNPIRKQ